MVNGSKKELEGKDVSESLIPFDETKNEVSIYKREEMQISGDRV